MRDTLLTELNRVDDSELKKLLRRKRPANPKKGETSAEVTPVRTEET